MHSCRLAQHSQITTDLTGAKKSCSQAAAFALSWEEHEVNRIRNPLLVPEMQGDCLPAAPESYGLEQLDAAADVTRELQEGCLDLMALIEPEP